MPPARCGRGHAEPNIQRTQIQPLQPPMKIKNASAFLCAALAIGWASFASAQTPTLPVIPSGTYYASNYGALGNGTKDDTTNIQNAINAASTAGVGTVEITPGTFECGPLAFASSMNLQIDTG